jgi:hypothetical protein
MGGSAGPFDKLTMTASPPRQRLMRCQMGRMRLLPNQPFSAYANWAITREKRGSSIRLHSRFD